MTTNVVMKYDVEQICISEVTTALQTRSNGITTALQTSSNGIITASQRLLNGFSTASQRLRHTSSTDYKRMVFAWLSMWSVWLFLTRVCVRGRDKCLLLPLFSGLLVRYEWKFDGGTTVPPFASEIIYDSICDF